MALGLSVVLVAGCCQTAQVQPGPACPPPMVQPREMSKALLPPYRIEPPDVLLIEAVRLVPRSPYRLQPWDVLHIHVMGTLPDAPIRI